MEWLIPVLITILVTAYFAGMLALYSEPAHWQIFKGKASDHLKDSLFLRIFAADPLNYWLSMLVGYILGLFAFCYSITATLPRWFNFSFHPVLFLVIVIFTLFLIVFFITELPAKIFIKTRFVNQSATVFIPSLIFYLITYPLILFILWVRNLYSRWRLHGAGEFDLETLTGRSGEFFISEHPSGADDNSGAYDQEIEILHKALLFSKTRIRDCMIPRTELEAVDITLNIAELRDRFVSSGYSKIIVYRENIDNIVGFISSKELFKHPASIEEKLTPVVFVPETMPANRLLHEFIQDHRSIAVVVDEYGGTSGIVTLEDMMEEIFGDIEDEHDTDDLIEKKIRSNEFVLSGRHEIEHLNAEYGLNIPEHEDYDTLAGFILYHHHNFPKPNDLIEIKNFNIKVLKVSSTKIELVILKVKPEQ